MKHSVDLEEMVRLYADEGMTAQAVAHHVGVPYRTVLRYLEKAGAPMRRRGDPKYPELADRDWLEGQYIQQGKSTTQIAAALCCEPRTVSWWLENHRIPARSVGSEPGHQRNSSLEFRIGHSIQRLRMFGAPAEWDGVSEYQFAGRTRHHAGKHGNWTRQVLRRDGNMCVECGSTERLHVHHIKLWAWYPEHRYDPDNGVTLCRDCHYAVHGRNPPPHLAKYVERATSAPHPNKG